MPLLHIALQEGFTGDEVVLRIDGREVFRKPDVKTRTQIGRAATHEEQVSNGPLSVDVSLPRRKLQLAISLQIARDTYLGVSISPEGKLQHVVAHEPFGYV